MSWLFGIIGKYSPSDIKKFESIHGNPIHKIQSNNIYIVAGGIKETCLCSNDLKPSSQNKGWLVCGMGITNHGHQFAMMTATSWQKVLSENPPSLHQLNGHFAVIRWTENKINCYTDQLGFRNIFFTQTGNYSAFSTRPDWIAKLSNDCQINFEEFGSRWLLVNQLSHESILTNTRRLTQAGLAECTPSSISVKNHPWESHLAFDMPNIDFSEALRNLVLFPLQENNKLSLALSGGLDSRVLLSILLSSNFKNWSLHTIGKPDDPDVLIAEQISKDLEADHQFFQSSIPPPEESVRFIYDYVGQTMARMPVSQFLKFRYYSALHNQKKIVIDGGQGEIIRREFFNRLLFYGKKILLKGNIEEIYPFIYRHRASIFNSEILQIMKNRVLNQIRGLRENLPPVEEIGLEHWLDLFIIRTGFPNTTNLEQSRSDSEFINYMPFAQPSLLRKLFDIPVNERNNGKIFLKIIKQNHKKLAKYKRVKNGIMLPFDLSTLSSRIFISAKKKLGQSYSDSTPIQLLESISDFVQDTVHSTAVKKFEYYDYPQILRIVNEFYNGNKKLADELDWWLAFEIWRQIVYGK